jgi:hypothetical protein
VCLGAPAARGEPGRAGVPGPGRGGGDAPCGADSGCRRRSDARRRPDSFVTLQWHGDGFDLPEGASEVPEYAAGLEQTLGPGSLGAFLADVEAPADTTVALARSLFGRWLEQIARVPAEAIG